MTQYEKGFRTPEPLTAEQKGALIALFKTFDVQGMSIETVNRVCAIIRDAIWLAKGHREG